MSHRAALIASLAITILVALSVAVGPRRFIAGGSDSAAGIVTATSGASAGSAPLAADQPSGASVQILDDTEEATRQPTLPRSHAPEEADDDDRDHEDDHDEDDDDSYEHDDDD